MSFNYRLDNALRVLRATEVYLGLDPQPDRAGMPQPPHAQPAPPSPAPARTRTPEAEPRTPPRTPRPTTLK